MLNTVFRERCASTAYHVMFGRTPRINVSTLASSPGKIGKCKCWILMLFSFTKQVKGVVEMKEQLRKGVCDKVSASHSLLDPL